MNVIVARGATSRGGTTEAAGTTVATIVTSAAMTDRAAAVGMTIVGTTETAGIERAKWSANNEGLMQCM